MALQRFLDAQDDPHSGYSVALTEVRAGRKQSHWIWYVFPQVAGLGSSEMSRRYAIASPDEARAYFCDPVLGLRLAEITVALAALDLPLGRVVGQIDAAKVMSSLTLFEEIAAEYSDAEVPWCGQFEVAARQILEREERMGAVRCRRTLAFLRA